MRVWFAGLASAFALSATTALAADYAVLAPVDAYSRWAQDPFASAIVSKAAAELSRPPAPLPKLRTEGTLPGQGIRDASIAAKQDHPIALNFALAWRLTGDKRHLDAAGRYLDAWADIYRISLNPIDETSFDQLILAYDLTEADLAAPTRAKLDQLWRDMASGYLAEMEGRHKNAVNNWQSHRLKLATLAAFQTGDAALIGRARSAFRRQIAANIHADGTVYDFHHRDAIHYVIYGLDPLLMAALAARAHGEDWVSWRNSTGVGLREALDWLTPYALGEKVHQEFVRSTVPFDAQRAAAGQKQYVPHPWDPAAATNTFALASLFDPRYRHVRDSLRKRTGREPTAWLVLHSAQTAAAE